MFYNQIIKNLLLSMDQTEDDKIDIGICGDYKNKTVERSLLMSKNLNGATSYLISDTKQAFSKPLIF